MVVKNGDIHPRDGHIPLPSLSSSSSSFSKRIFNSFAYRATVAIICALMFLLSTICFVLICIFHSHLLFQCSYAEFLFIVCMQAIVTVFCAYHFHGLYNFIQRYYKLKKREMRKLIAVNRRTSLDENQGLLVGVDANVAHDNDDDGDDNDTDDGEERRKPHFQIHNHLQQQQSQGRPSGQYHADENESDDSDEEDDNDDFEQENDKNSISFRVKRVAWIMTKLFGVAASFAALGAFIVFTVVSITYQQITLPQINGELKLDGCCTGKTTIHRESSGVIHIEAEHNLDLFFAQGVAAAQERMWQLEFNKRIASGTLSEIVGSEGVSIDKWSRTIGFRRAAVKDVENGAFLDEDMQILNAYCDGINAFYKSNPVLAPEFSLLGIKPTAWEPADIIAWGKIVAWGLSLNGGLEAMRYAIMANKRISVDRINTLFPAYPINDPSAPTVLTKEDLNINTTMEEDIALENKFTNDSAAYYPSAADIPTHTLASVGASMGAFIDQYMHLTKTLQASNNWVVSGKFTKDKNAILCDDPHLELTAPSIWMLMHIKSNNGINAMGAVFPGMPGVIIGKNEHIAWGVTNAGADVQDLFVMQDAGDGKYHHKGKTLSYEVVKEVIKVKGAANIDLDVQLTKYGPIINDVMGLEGAKEKLALWWVAIQPGDTTASSFSRIFRASDWTSFVEALKPYVVPAQNFIFADKDARIGYYMPGKVPIRREGHSGRFPVIGDGTYDFMDEPDGFIPFEQLPHVFEPKSGFIISANNRIVPPGYPYSISQDFENKYRAWRIHEKITERVSTADIDVSFMKQLMMDAYSKLFEEYKFALQRTEGIVKPSMASWLKMLLEWNGVQGENIQQPTVFEQWFAELTKLTEPEIGFAIPPRHSDFLKQAILHEDPSCMKYHNMSCTAFVSHALEQAIMHLQTEYGNNIPLWGTEIHESLMPHAILDNTLLGCLASKSVFNIGGTFTVNVASTIHPSLQVVEGVSYRQIVTMGPFQENREMDQFIIPLGQSGNWLSKHYANWMFMWRDGQFLPMDMKNYNKAASLTLA